MSLQRPVTLTAVHCFAYDLVIRFRLEMHLLGPELLAGIIAWLVYPVPSVIEPEQ